MFMADGYHLVQQHVFHRRVGRGLRVNVFHHNSARDKVDGGWGGFRIQKSYRYRCQLFQPLDSSQEVGWSNFR